MDYAALREACDAVEELRAALSASAASEEAARLEVDGLRSQLAEQKADGDQRFGQQLRHQTERMRLHQRCGELLESASLERAAAEGAKTDVQVLRLELARAEAAAQTHAADLAAARQHHEVQLDALQKARSRDAAEHERRLRTHEEQLERLRAVATSEQRIDPRTYVSTIEPVYAALREGLRHELDLSATIGASWATAEAEAALARAATAEARRDEHERAAREEARLRREQAAADQQALRASADLHVEELKAHVASLLSELQEKDAASRASQQRVLEQLGAERDAFHEALKGMQAQLAATRAESTRLGRVRSRLVAKVMRAPELTHTPGARSPRCIEGLRARAPVRRESGAHTRP